MSGRWREVWRKKMGLDPEDDLSGEFRVQLGSLTEPFNLAWTMLRTGREINYYSANRLMRGIWVSIIPDVGLVHSEELVVSRRYPWMACNLDGMTTTPQGQRCPIDAKHVGRTGEAMVVRYTAAGTHQATVTGCDWWALSVIVGNKWIEPIYQQVDPLYQAALIAKEKAFWSYVERQEEPPEDQVAVAPPKPQPRLRTILLDELTEGGSDWPNWAGDIIKEFRVFAETKPAADKHAITREAIKALVPEDVGLLTWGLCKVTRDRRGVSIALKKDAGDA